MKRAMDSCSGSVRGSLFISQHRARKGRTGEGTEGSKPSSPSFWSDEVLNLPVPVHGMTVELWGRRGSGERNAKSETSAILRWC